jgi:basic membrane lipoprotein Med (substrate-binding protein (PBP1-ABC) superfamily)
VVYLAEQEFPKRKVALKLLALELAEDEAFRERFIRESNAAASIDDPNIVPIYGAGEADGGLYIAMRYVEGTDLRRLLDREGALDPIRAVSIVSQAASALDTAHARGLVHRDVKPGNILLAARTPGSGPLDHVYVSDFGLIKRRGAEKDLTRSGQIMGSVDYIAPEQILGNPVDGRTDVYSLGCVLYECLTGEPPFPGEVEAAVLWAHVHEKPPKPSALRPDLPAGIDDVVARATAKLPEDRYATCGDLATAARAKLGAEVGEAAVRLTFQTDQAAFLAGYLAAGMTKSGTIGTFGGINIPLVTIFMNGFAAGILDYNKENGTSVKLLGWDPTKQDGTSTGDFTNQDNGKRIAEQFISQGADIILPVAGPVGLGAAAAAQDAGDVMMIGVDTDQFVSAPEYGPLWLTSICKRIDVVVEEPVRGNFKGGVYEGTLKNGGVDIAPFHDQDARVPQELKDRLKELKAGIISGTVSVDPRDYLKS